MFTSNFYTSSPIFIQNILLSLRDLARSFIRDNWITDCLIRQLRKNEYDAKALKNYRHRRLKKKLAALMLTPYYKKIKDLKLKNKSSKLTNLPILNKKDLIEHHADFFSKKPFFMIAGSTSGTTGGALSIPQNIFSVILEYAFIKRHLIWAGYKEGDRRAWIRGDLIVKVSQKKPPYWRYSFFNKVLYLSSFHLSKDSIFHYVYELEKFNPAIIQTYPSSLALIAHYMNDIGASYQGCLKSIVTSSETLSEFDRIAIEKFFKCKVFDWYGLFERVAAIGNCEHGNYHVIDDYAIHEFYRQDKNNYEIVGTNLNNNIFHIARYKTGDFAQLAQNKTCACGRIYPLIGNIKGRVGDYLLGEDGNKVYILNHISKNIDGVLEIQFIQKQKYQIEVLVVANPIFFGEEQKIKIRDNIKERLGKSIEVKITLVDEIPRTKLGKFRQAICEIKTT